MASQATNQQGSRPAADIEYGEVFTRRWVVDFMLDLAGYRTDQPLYDLCLVEPSCGGGAFLGPIVERLSQSLRRADLPLERASDAIAAFDLQAEHVESSKKLVVKLLTDDGWPVDQSQLLADRWVSQGDYLLAEHGEGFADLVIGNPPYIRLEDIPADRFSEYRKRCNTMGGRADIYVGFFEVGLKSLRPNGQLVFICADRWMRNQYGARLRELVSTSYSIDTVIVAHDVDAFEEQVSAYPAITSIRSSVQGPVAVVGTDRDLDEKSAPKLSAWLDRSQRKPEVGPGFDAAELPRWFSGSGSWPAGSPRQLEILEYLNDNFSALEDKDTGTKIGIGVATGADGVFVVDDSIDIEPERLLPLSMGRDTRSGQLIWSGHYLANPWEDDGSLVDLDRYPRLAKYFESHQDTIAGRNVAKRNDSAWYRTIDKVDATLTAKPKLLFPDMKMTSHPVFDEGGLYPHHGLYFVTSTEWDLQVLGGLLLSKVAEFFIDRYAVKMRGGTMRFQAQYLRRIRVPSPKDLGSRQAARLRKAFANRDSTAATAVALEVYGLPSLSPMD